MALLATIRAAQGLTVEAATSRIDPRRTDALQLSGRARGLALDGSAHLTLAIDRFLFTIPGSALRRRRNAAVYRGPAG